jgi:hypothetical protein
MIEPRLTTRGSTVFWKTVGYSAPQSPCYKAFMGRQHGLLLLMGAIANMPGTDGRLNKQQSIA